VALAQSWKDDASTAILRIIWDACDLLVSEVLSSVDLNQVDHILELELTQYLAPRMHKVMSGYEPFTPVHKACEFATQMSSQAQPPEYDIAFQWYDNPRSMWPLEAKVIRTEGAVAEYIKEVTDNFLTCRYAPFSSEGAMLGYLVSGEPKKTLLAVASKLCCALSPHPGFRSRDHSVSDHQRTILPHKVNPQQFRCHHMILLLH
jgi:hypothetical protein